MIFGRNVTEEVSNWSPLSFFRTFPPQLNYIIFIPSFPRFVCDKRDLCVADTGPSLASQHETAVNDAQQIWRPLIATRAIFLWRDWASGRWVVTSHSPAVGANGRRQSKEYLIGCTSVVVDISTEVSQVDYSCCVVPFSRVEFSVLLRRKSLYYIINFVLPCCVFSVLSIITRTCHS